jgi:L-ascorbate metabolism protein UlaG (beta-lactamase superfamily)
MTFLGGLGDLCERLFDMRLCIFFFLMAGLASRIHAGIEFDEQAWRQRVMTADSAKLYTPHVKGETFINPWDPLGHEDHDIWKLLKWRFSRPDVYTEEEKNYLPRFIPGALERVGKTEGDFILWVGHATLLIRINGIYWLTDPMLSKRAVLPKRRTPAALTLEELKSWKQNLNVILSHSHYDHMDKKTLRALPSQTVVHVPLGLEEIVSKFGTFQIIEMDWWQSDTLPSGQVLTCLPSQHWSKRIGAGEGKTLWASYMIASDSLKIFFGGDTGYFIGFREFGRKFGPVDYALLPVGAYHPRWFMHYSHMNITEALDAFLDLQAKHFIPMHWGAFELGDEPAGYPALDLQRTLKQRSDINPDAVLQMDVGEIRRLGAEF